MGDSLLDVTVHAKLDKIGKRLVFEMQIKDDSGTDLTDMFRLYAQLEETDLDNKDRIDVIIKKAK